MRKRKAVTYRIDETVVNALKELAIDRNTSVNKFLETHLFNLLKSEGYISEETRPLGETRGGDRSKADEDAEE
ncbi:hypothetical protein [Fischerella sp. PCC 9605]|uniref:hypothetical protein n=1 Tax=Fischerella sp. PCC 9605 TaxID=1173024 RepID=UPI0004798812|nr:hypothetical protein [Fischerella sp. PCC 9605]